MQTENACCSCDLTSKTTFKTRFKELATNTSMHGLPNAVKAPMYLRKCFWAMVFLAGIGVFVWQIEILAMKFRTYPTSTSVSMKSSTPMKFPAITICNINAIRKTALQSENPLAEYFESDDIFNATEGDVMENWFGMENATGFFENFDPEMERTFSIYETYTSMDRETRMQIGHQMEDMLLSCSFGGRHCSPRNFSQFLNYKFGNCYVFNSGTTAAGIKNVDRTGPEYGLVLTLFVEHDTEYIEDMADSVGVKLLIHDQNTMPFPEDSGYSISVGTKTAVSLSMIDIHRIESPHGDCKKFSAEENIKVNMYVEEDGLDVDYSQEACSKTCFQRALIKNCSCCSYNFQCYGMALFKDVGNHDENITTCKISNATQADCLSIIETKFNNNKLSCQESCPSPCRERVYSVDISSAMWPSNPHLREVYDDLTSRFETISKSFETMSPSEKEKFVRDNLLKVEVFFRTLNYEDIQTEEAYSDVSLISDIGGQMGLWLGLSVLTLFEFVELFIDLLAMAVLKLRKSGSVDTADDETPESVNEYEKKTPKAKEDKEYRW